MSHNERRITLPDLSLLRLHDTLDTECKRSAEEQGGRSHGPSDNQASQAERLEALGRFKQYFRLIQTGWTPLDANNDIPHLMEIAETAVAYGVECLSESASMEERFNAIMDAEAFLEDDDDDEMGQNDAVAATDVPSSDSQYHKTKILNFFQMLYNGWRQAYSDSQVRLERPPKHIQPMERLDGSVFERLMKHFASAAHSGYFVAIQDSDNRLLNAQNAVSTRLQNLAALGVYLPPTVAKIHVHFSLNRSSKQILLDSPGLFSPPGTPTVPYCPSNGGSLVTYNFASYTSNGIVSNHIKGPESGYPVGTLVYPLGFPVLADESAQAIASAAMTTGVQSEAKVECTMNEWKHAVQCLYGMTQVDASSLVTSAGIHGGLVTNMDVVATASNTSFTYPWAVMVTLEHSPDGAPAPGPPEVLAVEDLRNHTESWNEVIYPYKGGRKAVDNANVWTKQQLTQFMGGFGSTVTETNVLVRHKKVLDEGGAMRVTPTVLNFVYGSVHSNTSVFLRGIGIGPQGRIPSHGRDAIDSTFNKCVNVTVDEMNRTLTLNSLFHAVGLNERLECDIYVGANRNSKDAAGSTVLQMLFDISVDLKFNNIRLTDASKFAEYKKKPFYEDVRMTNYLRLRRGYGFYEGVGFVQFNKAANPYNLEDTLNLQQQIMNFYHKLFTTPIRTLRIWGKNPYDLRQELYLPRDGLNESGRDIAANAQLNMPGQMKAMLRVENLPGEIESMSPRDIVKEFNALAEEYRPKPDEFTHDLWDQNFHDLWDQRVTAAFQFSPFKKHLKSAATRIVKSTCNSAELFNYGMYDSQRKVFFRRDAQVFEIRTVAGKEEGDAPVVRAIQCVPSEERHTATLW